MCWSCCDCEVISNPGNPLIMQCVGFKERKPYIVMMGRLTGFLLYILFGTI